MNMAQLGKHTRDFEHYSEQRKHLVFRRRLPLPLAPSPSLTPDPDPNPNPTPTPNPNLPICRSVGPSGMRHLQVGVAPEPSDVFWDNLELSKRDRISWC